MLYRISTLLLLLLLSGFAFAQTPYFKGASYYHGNNSNYIENICTDPQGNVYAAGYFYGDITLGSQTFSTGSNSSGYVMKTDSSGNVIWVHRLSGPSIVVARAIGRDPAGNIFLGGYYRESMTAGTTTLSSGTSVNSIFLVKYDAAGNQLWARNMDGPVQATEYYTCAMNDLCTDQAGNVYFTGFFTNSISYQSQTLNAYGRNDIILGKLNPQGDVVWLRKAGGASTTSCGLDNNDNGQGICLDSKGNVYITGHYAFNATFDSISVTSSHNADVYTAKYNNNGNVLWVRSEGGMSWELGTSIACDKDDNVYALGHFQLDITIGGQQYVSQSQSGSQYDVYLIKYDSTGAVAWVKQEGGTLSEYGEEVLTDDAGNIYICGTYQNNAVIAGQSLSLLNPTATHCYVVKYDASGSAQYVATGGGYDNFPRAMALNRQNDIVLAGNASGIPGIPLVFGNFPAPVQNGRYAFITVLDDPFNVVGIEDRPAASWVVYPNPSSGKFRFQGTDGPDGKGIEVMDLSGRSMWEGRTVSGEMDLGFLAEGVYLLVLRGEDGQPAGRQLVRIVR